MLVEAENVAPSGSELQIRLQGSAALIARKIAPDPGTYHEHGGNAETGVDPGGRTAAGCQHNDAFDLAFLTRDLPVEFEGKDHGVPEDVVEAYRRSHAG